MARHAMPSATFVGHSLGSVYLSWVAKLDEATGDMGETLKAASWSHAASAAAA